MDDNRTIDLVAPEEAQGERLDRVLAALLADFSRSRLQALIKEGRVGVGGRTIWEPRHPVNAGEALRVEVPPPEPAVPQAEDIPLTVVHEDADLIVVDKPAGLVVHPGAGNWRGTLVNALLHHAKGELPGIGGVERPGIVHRIDKDTSGLLVVAKTEAAHRALSAQFADHGREGPLERAYLAFVWGVPSPRKGTIDAPLGRSRQSPERQEVRAGARHAVTHYRVLEAYPDPTRPGESLASLVECRLETGRTHQIRVHMAHIGHPLIGDETYAKGYRTKARRLGEDARKLVETLERQALHAYLLVVSHPVTGEDLRFESALPPELEALRRALAGS
ncbi:RluA family pseudouridine synthase [Lutibaculum baratangense]|nr:RluA family pseudouridine synthase [Lutibaculum baratangense]